MKRFFVATCLLFSFYACSKIETVSGNELPVALNLLIDSSLNCTCDPYINKYAWHEKIVYVQQVAGPACSSMPMYYDSTGVRFQLPANYTYNDFGRDAKFIKMVWSCKTGRAS